MTVKHGSSGYSSMKVDQLKELLRERRLKVGGRKRELVSRLENNEGKIRGVYKVKIERGRAFGIEDIKTLIRIILRSKMRASFNSETPKRELINSRSGFFSSLENRGVRVLHKSRDPDGPLNEENLLKLAREMTPWNSPEFYIDSTPISDSRFGCTNNSMLEEKGGLYTFIELKTEISNALHDDHTKKTCRNCIESLNGHSINHRRRNMKISENSLIPADCALNGGGNRIKENGLGIRFEVSQEVDSGNWKVNRIELGSGICREFDLEIQYLDMGAVKITRTNERIDELDLQNVELRVISEESGSGDIRRIWRERGYKENVRSEFTSDEDSSTTGFQERSFESFWDLLTGIKLAWNPLLFMDPSEFLLPTNSIDLDNGDWPVRYIEMGNKMQDLVESELMQALQTPVVSIQRDGVVVFSLDNVEFWR